MFISKLVEYNFSQKEKCDSKSIHILKEIDMKFIKTYSYFFNKESIKEIEEQNPYPIKIQVNMFCEKNSFKVIVTSSYVGIIFMENEAIVVVGNSFNLKFVIQKLLIITIMII